LHSSIVQTRKSPTASEQARGDSIRDHRLDRRPDVRALYQRAILVMAAATFHGRVTRCRGHFGCVCTARAMLGTTFASVLFAVALLCSGQNATLTGTLAGQIVMEVSSTSDCVRGCGGSSRD